MKLCLALLLALVAWPIAGCQPPVEDDALMVGFGPPLAGQPVGYCQPRSPILAWPAVRRLLDSPLPVVRPADLAKIDNEEKLAAFMDAVLARLAPGAEFVIDDRALQDSGLQFQAPPRSRRGLTVKEFLEGCYGNRQDLGFRLRDHVLTLSSRTKINENLCVAFYPIEDLLAPVLNRQGTVIVMTREERARKLSDLIQKFVRNEELWEDSGGRASIQFSLERNLLIVTQSPEGHLQLTRFLSSLRLLGPPPPDPKPAEQ